MAPMITPARISKPGLHFSMSSSDYFADPCVEPSLTQSLCKVLLDQSPLHAKYEHPRMKPALVNELEVEKYDKTKAIGNAAHKLLIGRGKELEIADLPDWRGKDAALIKAKAASEGKEPILTHHFAEAINVVKAARQQLDAAGWKDAFNEGNGEVVAVWQENGLWFRTMIDWLSLDQCELYDLKTSGLNYAPHGINRHMVSAGWDIQAAMHERALNALDPDNAGRRKYRFAALENYPPFALVPVELTEAWLVMGRKKLDVAVNLWRDAIQSGRFAGYGSSVVRPDYPGYAETQWLDREIKDAAHARIPMTEFTPDILAAG